MPESDLPTLEEIARWRKLFEASTSGEWESDNEQECSERTGHQVMYGPNGKSLFDTINSDAAEIHTEHDEYGAHYWDETGRANFAFCKCAHGNFQRLLSAAEEAVRLKEQAYAPEIAAELAEMLHGAGFGNQTGEANTIWGMTAACTRAVVSLRAEVARLKESEGNDAACSDEKAAHADTLRQLEEAKALIGEMLPLCLKGEWDILALWNISGRRFDQVTQAKVERYCETCTRREESGHSPDCPRAAVLKRAREMTK